MFLKKSDRLAIVDFDGRKIDYNEMIDSIKYLARNIFENIKEKDNVLIISENRLEWIYSYFAIWDKLATPVCVDALSSKEEIEYFIKDCNAKIIIATNKTIENIKDLKDITIYNLDELDIKQLDDDIELKHPKEDNLATMIYTSGTTGDPKGVMLSFNNLYHEIRAIESFEVTYDDEQTLAILPFHHILPLMSTVLYYFYYEHLYSVVLCPKLNSTEILRALKENNVTMLSSVPRLYKMFYKSISDKINSKFITRLIFKIVKKINNKKLSKIVFKKVHETFGGKLRTFIAGGGKSDPKIIEFFNAIGFDYFEGYGLSETSPVFLGSVPKHYKVGTVGKAVSNVEITVVDNELWVKGPIVMLGYYNKPEKTKEVITEDGWFKTGDLVEVDNEGYITITGRKNSMIVLSNGKNIDPEKLENKLLEESKDLISEVGIFGQNDKLKAVIVPNFEYIRSKKIGNITTHIRDIVQVYNSNVHNYEKILEYRVVEQELPKTRVGKLRRFKLKDIFGGNIEKKVIEKEPDINEYKVLKKYIENQKGITEISKKDNFEVELGLDSLDLVEFKTYIENSYNINLKEDIFLENYNLELLSNYIKEYAAEFNENSMNIENIIKSSEKLNLKRGMLHYLARPLVYVFAKIYFRLSIKGVDKIKNKPTIFIANHESFIDAPLLIYAIPFKMRIKTYFLALGKYFKSPVMNFIANNSNVITIDIEKNVQKSIEKIAGVLKNNDNVFIFPEGSRTKDGSLQEFKKIFAILSKELNIEIQCIGINGAYEAYSRFSYLPRPKKISIEVLDRVNPKDKTYEEIIDECVESFVRYKEKFEK